MKTKISTLLTKLLRAFLIPLAMVAENVAADEQMSEIEPSFEFIGIDLFAKSKVGWDPVLFATRKGLHVEMENGVKRRKYSDNYMLSQRWVTTPFIVEILESEIRFDYARARRLEAEALDDVLNYEELTYTEKAGLSRGDGDNHIRIAEFKEGQKELERYVQNSIMAGDFDSEVLMDTIFFELEMVSPLDVKGAFCAITMKYLQPNPHLPNSTSPTTAVSLRRLGDLMADIPAKFKFRCTVPEGYRESAVIQFYLLSGAIENLGTTVSNGLRPVKIDD